MAARPLRLVPRTRARGTTSRRDVLRGLFGVAAIAGLDLACGTPPASSRKFRIGSLSPRQSLCVDDPANLRIVPFRSSRTGPIDDVALRTGMAPKNCWDGLLLRELSARGYRESENVEWIAVSPNNPDVRRASDFQRAVQTILTYDIDLLVTVGASASFAAKEATRTIPVIACNIADVVETGLVASLARPGGNITGRSVRTSETGVKCLELLKEAFPSVRKPILVYGLDIYDAAASEHLVRPTVEAARKLGLEPFVIPPDGSDIATFAEIALEKGADSLVDVLPGAYVLPVYSLIRQRRLPAISAWTGEALHGPFGFVLGYGPDESDAYVMLSDYIDRVLKGAKPGELPIVNPPTSELAVNLVEARALGLTIPDSVVARATKVVR